MTIFGCGLTEYTTSICKIIAIQGRVHNLANSWQQPIDAEPGGGTWHPIEDPGTGYLASKTSGWTADSFSTSTTSLTVDFSSVVPAGSRAVRTGILLVEVTQSNDLYYRKDGDTSLSTNPNGSSEFSHRLVSFNHAPDQDAHQHEIWLSTGYKAQFAVRQTSGDVYVSYPSEYMI